jgi:hypothetical protein
LRNGKRLGSRKDRRFVEFARGHSSILEGRLSDLATKISNELDRAEATAAELHFFHGAACGILDYVRRLHKEAQERKGRDATSPGYVYAIRSGVHLKIGFANDLQQRINDLQVSSPHEIELIGSVTGYREHERRIQMQFAPYRVRGEWFRDCDAIRRFFASTVTALTPPSSRKRAGSG